MGAEREKEGDVFDFNVCFVSWVAFIDFEQPLYFIQNNLLAHS